MPHPATLPESVLQAVRARYLACLSRWTPELLTAGERLLARLAPERWLMEWALPVWLGTAFSLPAPIIEDLVFCNLCGLGFIRLQDDLADGEVTFAEQSSAVGLSATLYRETLRQYGRLFPADSDFWPYLDQWLSDWIRALPLRDSRKPDASGLSDQGAPLKICCAATCLLAGRQDALPAITSALDYVLLGLVMLDHALDWPADLAAGRYNAFVAETSSLAQTPEHSEANRAQVLEAIYLGSEAQRYFARLGDQLRIAREIIAPLRLPELDPFLQELGSQATAFGENLIAEAHQELRTLANTVFGPAAG